jgi:hypothetical protein
VGLGEADSSEAAALDRFFHELTQRGPFFFQSFILDLLELAFGDLEFLRDDLIGFADVMHHVLRGDKGLKNLFSLWNRQAFACHDFLLKNPRTRGEVPYKMEHGVPLFPVYAGRQNSDLKIREFSMVYPSKSWYLTIQRDFALKLAGTSWYDRGGVFHRKDAKNMMENYRL